MFCLKNCNINIISATASALGRPGRETRISRAAAATREKQKTRRAWYHSAARTENLFHGAIIALYSTEASFLGSAGAGRHAGCRGAARGVRTLPRQEG